MRKITYFTCNYDVFDLEGWMVGEAVTAISTIVQTSRWEHHPKLSSNVAVLNQLRISILKQLIHLFNRALPRDCHVSRQPRLPRNDRLIAALHQTRRSAIATKEAYKCRLYTYLAVGGEVLPRGDIFLLHRLFQTRRRGCVQTKTSERAARLGNFV